MACEGKGFIDESSVFVTVSPCTEKRENSMNNQTTCKILFAITVIAIVVVGVVSVAYMCLDSSSSRGHKLDQSKGNVIVGEHRKEFLLEFILGGKSHKELIQVDEDQNLVIISDEDAGFSVTLDYDRGIAMIKNTTSSDCFFTRVEHIPDYKTNGIETVRPIVVQEVRNFSSLWTTSNAETITLLQTDVVPPEYLQLSNPAISKQCIDSASYWLEGIPPIGRQKRKMAEDFVTWLAGIPLTERQKRKMAEDFVTGLELQGISPNGRQKRKMAEDFVTGLELQGISPTGRQKRKMSDDFVSWIPPTGRKRSKTADDISTWVERKSRTGRKRRDIADDFVTWLDGNPTTHRVNGKMGEDFVTWIPITIQHHLET